jgi:tetratricopeptide (TPR) repeat protein
MTREKYEQLVRKLEKQAQNNMGLYRAKVVLFASLAYVYIWVFLLLFVPLLLGAAFDLLSGHVTIGRINMVLTLGPLVFFIIRAMMIRSRMPEGVVLKREDAPALFATLDDLKERMQAPEIHTVILDENFNASVMQYSRFGLFGKKQNILVIGFPLLLSLSPEQMKSVLAHELGHVSKADTSIGAWIYRVNRTWGRLLEDLEKDESEKFGRMIFKPFFKWYYPRFSALSFVMRRRQEYVADSFAARMTTPKIAGEALIQVHVKGEWYTEKFLSETVVEKVWESGSVPRLFSLYREKVKELSREEQEEILKACLEQETDLTDTHPCLRERLAALGVEPVLPEPVERTAAEAYLPHADQWTEGFDHVWNELYGGNLQEAVDSAKEMEEEFQRLREKENKTPREYALLAQMVLKREGTDAALEVCREAVQQYPDSEELGIAHAILGQHLLQNGQEEEAIRHIEKSVELDWELRERGLLFLESWYMEREDDQEVRRVQRELERWRKYLKKTDSEVKDYKDPERWMTADLPDDIIEQMIEDILEWETVERVYVAQLNLSRSIPRRKHYVVGVYHEYDDDMGFRNLMKYMEAFEKWSENEWLPHLPVSIIDLTDDEDLLEEFEKIEESLIFCRSEWEEEMEDEEEEKEVMA